MKKLSYLLYVFFCLFVLNVTVFAASTSITNVQSTGDLIVITASGSVSRYCIGTTNNVSASTTKCYSSTKTTYYLSVKNGTYYLWVTGSGRDASSLSYNAYSANPVTITSSCKNETKTNMTNSGTVERCFIATAGKTPTAEVSGNLVSCANGYKLTTSVKENKCSTGLNMIVGTQSLSSRYCRVVFAYTCTKTSDSGSTTQTETAAATLASLAVNSGSLSPAFSASTKKYTVSVDSNVSSIKINATVASGSTFVSGYGSRTVKLNYGSNKAYVKVKNSAGNITTYTLTITRADNRSSVNTLDSITLSSGTLSPTFEKTTYDYTATVARDVTSVDIKTSLTNSKASYVENYGPRTVSLNEGNNKVEIKVKSENGKQAVYSINIIRETIPSECTTNVSEKALLKAIELSAYGSTLSALNFDPYTKTYDVTVPYDVTSIEVNAFVNDEGDKVEVVGNDNLSTEEVNYVTITVTNSVCDNITSTYTLNVTRSAEQDYSNESYIETLTIKGHDEVDFAPSTTKYDLYLAKGETSIANADIDFTAAKDANCTISGNTEMKMGSTLYIECVAQDSINKTTYEFTVTKVTKGTNIVLVVILIIIAILVLVYFVLRLLGYKIVINMSIFDGITSKIKSLFGK